jgi:hypothetical protein
MQKPHVSFLVPACFCAGVAATASAQADTANTWQQAGSHVSPSVSESVSRHLKTPLRGNLERMGILNSSGPYPVALPLVSFGNKGPILMFTFVPRMKETTFVPRMKDETGHSVFLFYIHHEWE